MEIGGAYRNCMTRLVRGFWLDLVWGSSLWRIRIGSLLNVSRVGECLAGCWKCLGQEVLPSVRDAASFEREIAGSTIIASVSFHWGFRFPRMVPLSSVEAWNVVRSFSWLPLFTEFSLTLSCRLEMSWSHCFRMLPPSIRESNNSFLFSPLTVLLCVKFVGITDLGYATKF